MEWLAPDVSFEKTTEEYKIAQVQIHGSYEGRTSVIKELTLAEFIKEPDEILDDRKKELASSAALKDLKKKEPCILIMINPDSLGHVDRPEFLCRLRRLCGCLSCRK